jgi:hypothetical protein
VTTNFRSPDPRHEATLEALRSISFFRTHPAALGIVYDFAEGVPINETLKELSDCLLADSIRGTFQYDFHQINGILFIGFTNDGRKESLQGERTRVPLVEFINCLDEAHLLLHSESFIELLNSLPDTWPVESVSPRPSKLRRAIDWLSKP